jgi:exodeoxyribonuclease VII large subunit
MNEKIKLSSLVRRIQDAIGNRFDGEFIWVSAQITNVKRDELARRCYLSLEEYENGQKTADIRGVFWSNYFDEIKKFEQATGQVFKNGIEITCRVKVKFHTVFGLSVDIMQIDIAHTPGSLELQRQQTLERLVKENPNTIQLYDGIYRTFNNRLPLEPVISNIALVTAPNSDGQRDFQQEIAWNKHGYTYAVTEFLTTIQGDNAHRLILEQLKRIEERKEDFDAVAIIRGGGSQTDFKPFDDYELCRYVAHFPVPVFTGIGHDRNQSIIDLMAREQKTPTKVASLFVDHNLQFENQLIALRTALYSSVSDQVEQAKLSVEHARRIVKLSSPEAILNRGFAIIMQGDRVIANPVLIEEDTAIQTILKDTIIHSTVTGKTNR